MAKLVKCPYCGEQFDRETTPWKRVLTNRYAHQSCAEKNLLADTERKNIIDYVGVNVERPNWPVIRRQIKNYTDRGYTLEGIYGTLVYAFEIKKISRYEGNGGIGIVPYLYDEAREYYRRQRTIAEKAREISSGKRLSGKTTTQIIYNKKNIRNKKDKLLPLDWRDD